jgi:hypothetical protein
MPPKERPSPSRYASRALRLHCRSRTGDASAAELQHPSAVAAAATPRRTGSQQPATHEHQGRSSAAGGASPAYQTRPMQGASEKGCEPQRLTLAATVAPSSRLAPLLLTLHTMTTRNKVSSSKQHKLCKVKPPLQSRPAGGIETRLAALVKGCVPGAGGVPGVGDVRAPLLQVGAVQPVLRTQPGRREGPGEYRSDKSRTILVPRVKFSSSALLCQGLANLPQKATFQHPLFLETATLRLCRDHNSPNGGSTLRFHAGCGEQGKRASRGSSPRSLRERC